MAKPESTSEYVKVFEILRKAVPEGTSVLSIIRATEFMLADCIAQGKLDNEQKEQFCKLMAEDVMNFVKAFENV